MFARRKSTEHPLAPRPVLRQPTLFATADDKSPLGEFQKGEKAGTIKLENPTEFQKFLAAHKNAELDGNRPVNLFVPSKEQRGKSVALKDIPGTKDRDRGFSISQVLKIWLIDDNVARAQIGNRKPGLEQVTTKLEGEALIYNMPQRVLDIMDTGYSCTFQLVGLGLLTITYKNNKRYWSKNVKRTAYVHVLDEIPEELQIHENHRFYN